jgi:hypothetical protein
MELEKEIFEGKTVSQLIREVYDKQKENDKIVKDNIDRLSTFINTPGDAIVIIPLLKELLDSGLKNDEVFMKILNLFKQSQEKAKASQEDNGVLSDEDIAKLFNDVHTANDETKKIAN